MLRGSSYQKDAATENQFTGQIDSRLVPNGPQQLIVITEERRARAEIPVTVKNNLQIYFGDLHSHTSYSDGALLPSIAHEYARNVAKLDVFCLSDHLETVDDAEWLDIRETAWDANEDGKFVAIPSLEWTKGWGHLNIYDAKVRVWPEDPTEFYQAAANAGVVLKFNHPGDGTKSHGGLAYSEVGDKAVQLMEVRFPDEEKAFIRALQNGWHIAPEGSDDTHSPNWGNSKMWSGILAPGLTKRNILDALAKRHVYSTLDRNCRLMFRVNDAVMGDIIEEPLAKIDAMVRVADEDSTDSVAKIDLFEDGTVVETKEQSANWSTIRTPKPGKHFYFVRVTQADGNMLWSAPVWVTAKSE